MARVVCHMSTVHPTYDTRIFHKECVSLVQADFDVHLVIQGVDGKVDGVSIHGLRQPRNRLDRMSRLAREAFKKALSVDAELYHLHDPELLGTALKLKRNGKHVIFDSHEFYRYQIAEKDYLPSSVASVLSHGYSQLETMVCRQIDAVIAPCTCLGKNPFEGRAQRAEIIDNLPILPKGIWKPVCNRALRDAICYVGGITYNRGITHLVKAAYRAGVKLILAGTVDDAYLTELRTMPEYECVDYRGFVDHRGVESIISESFCGIAALLDVGQYWLADNLPTKTYEYLAGGIPFIMSPTPYAQKFIREYPCCILVNPEDSDDYVKAIQTLKDDAKTAEVMAMIGYEAMIHRFNWNHEAEKLVELYEEVLA